MRIENLTEGKEGQLARVSATFVWEDCDRPPKDIYIETTKAFAQDISCNSHAFLIAGVLPAMYFGERRVAIEDEICPRLKDGLLTVMHWLHYWFKEQCQPIPIEARTKARLPQPQTLSRTGVFFSGGIDAWANLRTNRLHVPLDYPGSIKDCLVVDGLTRSTREYFETAVTSFSSVSDEMGVTIIPVYTNLYSHLMDLDQKYNFWEDTFNGAALAAVAHAFSRRLTVASISSGDDIPNLVPHGSHPCIDPHYNSHDLKIRHDNVRLSRLEKTRIVADWDVALQNLTVCNRSNKPLDGLNCGQCDKCVQTMMTLLALGKLDKTHVFPERNVSQKLLLTRGKISDPGNKAGYHDLIPLLEAQGRFDLVDGIRRLTIRYHDLDWKGWIKKCDRWFFNSQLMKQRKRLKSSYF